MEHIAGVQVAVDETHAEGEVQEGVLMEEEVNPLLEPADGPWIQISVGEVPAHCPKRLVDGQRDCLRRSQPVELATEQVVGGDDRRAWLRVVCPKRDGGLGSAVGEGERLVPAGEVDREGDGEVLACEPTGELNGRASTAGSPLLVGDPSYDGRFGVDQEHRICKVPQESD